MSFEDDFGLFFSFPAYYLTIKARRDEIITIQAIDIQNLRVVLIECFDETSLGEVPLLEG